MIIVFEGWGILKKGREFVLMIVFQEEEIIYLGIDT